MNLERLYSERGHSIWQRVIRLLHVVFLTRPSWGAVGDRSVVIAKLDELIEMVAARNGLSTHPPATFQKKRTIGSDLS